MEVFVVIFIVLLLAVAGMSVGVMFGRPPLKGSCGGLGAVGVEKACGCTDGCDQENRAKTDRPSEAKVTVYR